MKELDYVMKLMGTARRLFVNSNRDCCRTLVINGEERTTTFKYMEPFDLHFKHCHLIDNHTILHHSVPSIKETWIMKCWALRVFQFMLAVSEVNIYLGLHHFVEESDENMSLLWI